MLTLNDWVSGKRVLDKRWGLPGLSPSPTRIQHDVLRESIHSRKLPIERRRLIEIGAGVDPIALEGDVVRPQITQLKHPGLNAQIAGFFDGDAVGNDEIPVHKDVANATVLN